MKIVSIKKVTRILDSGIAIVRRDIHNCAVASHMQYVGADETMTKEEYANDVLQNIDRSIIHAYLEFGNDENLASSEIEKKLYLLTNYHHFLGEMKGLVQGYSESKKLINKRISEKKNQKDIPDG